MKLLISLSDNGHVSTSKKKSGKSNRQIFFSSLMKKLAGDRGNHISDLFVAQKTEDLSKELASVMKEIVTDSEQRKSSK